MLFESNSIVMTNNNVFVSNEYRSPWLFVLNVDEIMNEYASSFAYLIDPFDIRYARLGHISNGYIKKM